MKKNYLLHLTITILIFISCSSSENENLSETFLQKFDGTVWRFENNDANVYYLIENNQNNPVTKYVKLSNSDCFYISEVMSELDSRYESITIQETNELQIKSDYGSNENNIYTFTVSQNNIDLYQIENYFGNQTTWNYLLIKTNLSKNDIKPICP
ncbi:hypothetical protein [Polaribacter atrinae]|uniref:Uncharacterized protein n=1 Tax=Polaribacter atrinae TaxID=1333662 RepID=A0A176T0E0_9FLAO|nr:hypothetical protein [Polaribacter atrinae]OAD41349.1 hypothetical protein LPB303_15485 [Polaribacter atrinae]